MFKLADISLLGAHSTCFSKRTKTVNIAFKTQTRSTIEHFAIDSTDLKVCSEDECKVKKHCTDGKRRVWRKLHIVVDTHTHEIIGAELSLSNVTDAEVILNLLKQSHRTIRIISVDSAYDTRACHDTALRKQALVLIPPREYVALWEKVIRVT